MTFPVWRYSSVLLVALTLGGLRVGAQTTPLEGKRIVEIQYDPPQPLAPQDLGKAQPLKIGEPLRLADVSSAIDGLYATGNFTDIRVDAESSGADGVIIRFLTTQALFVGHVAMSGKTSPPPNRGQLVNATQLNLGTPYHDPDLQTAQTNLKRLLEADGLYEATITPALVREPGSQTVDITFSIKPEKGQSTPLH